MRIGLVDIDHHNYPNLAQMKLSAYHKAQGDDVEWAMPGEHYDRVYVSKVFSDSTETLPMYTADEIRRGGTGYAIRMTEGKEVYDVSMDSTLPYEVEHTMPDYSLYNITDTAYGFLTRGCPRGCSFCHVAAKEGRNSHRVADLGEFWDGQHNIVLNDPNILACPNWGGAFEQLIESKAMIDFNQGLDIRMMTEDKVEAINATKIKEIHFAWDRYEDKDKVLPKLELYARKAKKIHSHCAIVYTLVNFGSTLEQDLERIYTLREMGYWAYVMIYDKAHCKDVYRKLQRWCNNRFVFGACPRFENYNG